MPIQSSESEGETKDANKRLFFNLMEKVGTEGRYQLIMLIFWCLVLYICGGLVFITPYLLFQDPYQCSNELDQVACKQLVCKLPVEQRSTFIPPPSIQTLGNYFGDYRCPENKTELNSISSMLYFGGFIGFLALSLLGGVIGRKRLMIVSLAVAFLGFVITCTCVNLLMAGIGLLLTSLGLQNGYYISFYFISETVSEKYREKYLILIQLFFAVGGLSNVGYFYLVGNWKIILLIFYALPTLLVIICTMVWIKDTPMFLVTKNTPEKALKDFSSIAKINQISNFNLTTEGIVLVKKTYSDVQGKQKKNTFSLLDLFKYKSLRKKTIFFILLQIIMSFLFYAPSLMLAQYKMDIYISGLVVGFSQFIALPICFVVISKLPRKLVAFCFFSIACLCSIVLLFLWELKEPSTLESVLKLVFIFVFRFAITFEYSFYVLYINELFPTQVRVLGTSLVAMFAGLSSTMAPILIQICQNASFPIMVLFIIFSIAGILFSSQLEQTFQIPPSDLISEFKSQPITNQQIHSANIQIQQEDQKSNSQQDQKQNSIIGSQNLNFALIKKC